MGSHQPADGSERIINQYIESTINHVINHVSSVVDGELYTKLPMVSQFR